MAAPTGKVKEGATMLNAIHAREVPRQRRKKPAE
jgi:hypothetical protein